MCDRLHRIEYPVALRQDPQLEFCGLIHTFKDIFSQLRYIGLDSAKLHNLRQKRTQSRITHYSSACDHTVALALWSLGTKRITKRSNCSMMHTLSSNALMIHRLKVLNAPGLDSIRSQTPWKSACRRPHQTPDRLPAIQRRSFGSSSASTCCAPKTPISSANSACLHD